MNMRKISLTAAVLSACAFAGPALADFSGATAPANFTVANVGTLNGASISLGTAAFTSTQLVLTGSNAGGGCTGGVYSVLASPCQVQASINLPGRYSFNWAYTTADADGPAGDIFGVMVGSTRMALSDLGGAVSQSGSASFVTTSSFAWMLNCTDCTGAAATATISNFVYAPVPEPTQAALLMGGLLTLLASRRTPRATHR
jgi:hypothetical protein